MPGGGNPIRETVLAVGDVSLRDHPVVRVGGCASRQVNPHAEEVAGAPSPVRRGASTAWMGGGGRAELVNRSAWFDAYRDDLRRSPA